MIQDSTVKLEAESILYRSQYDEDAFFEWLRKLKCVQNIKGYGSKLYIDVDSQLVDREALCELMALFYRYEIDLSQLTAFDRPEFEFWFHDKNKYWYSKIFKD